MSESVYTEVDSAKKLVEATGRFLGGFYWHRAWYVQRWAHISFERLAELNAALQIPLVLHGGSGSGDENLARCAQGGIAKVNLYTDLFLQHEMRYTINIQQLGWTFEYSDEAMRKVLRHYYAVLRCIA